MVPENRLPAWSFRPEVNDDDKNPSTPKMSIHTAAAFSFIDSASSCLPGSGVFPHLQLISWSIRLWWLRSEGEWHRPQLSGLSRSPRTPAGQVLSSTEQTPYERLEGRPYQPAP